MNNKNKNPANVVRKSPSYYESHNRLVTTKLGQVEKILPKDACRILEACGSCSLLNLDYKTQLLQKTLKLKERLQDLGHLPVQHFLESEEKLAYRQSVKLVVSEHFVHGKPWIDIGFYRQDLNKIVDIGNCPIQNHFLNDINFYLRSALKIYKIPIYSPFKKTGVLSGLILRSSRATKQTFVTFLVKSIKPVLFREIACHLLEKFSNIQGIFLQLEDHETNKVTEPFLVAGTNILEEKFGSLKFKIAHDVELPIHPAMTSKIYARILELCDLNGSQNVLHLYSSFGALSCLLAQKARMVYALNEKLAYAKNTELNLSFHKIKNVQSLVGKMNETLSQLVASIQTCDVAVVMAPRLGVGKAFIEKLSLLSAQHIIYVSSFNEQMREDLKLLALQNYKPLFIEPFDTHPGTPYFEVLCYLKKDNSSVS